MNDQPKGFREQWKELSSPILAIAMVAMLALILAAIAAGTLIIKFEHPPGLINFNDGTKQGWTIDGFYDGTNTTQFQKAIYAWVGYVDISDKPLFNDPYDLKGSIGMPGGPGSIPTLNNAPSGWWRVDFISPDISSNSDWQNIKGVEVYVTDLISLTGFTPLNVQIMLWVKKPDGTKTFWIEKNNNKPVMTEINPTHFWERVENVMPVPSGHTVLNVYIRIFGKALASPTPGSGFSIYSSGYIAIDAISPL